MDNYKVRHFLRHSVYLNADNLATVSGLGRINA